MNKPIMSPRPKNQVNWTNTKLKEAVKRFMSGMDYDEIAEYVKPFKPSAIQKKLGDHGFTKEYRANKLGKG